MTLEAFPRVLPDAKLLNLYGSSEVAADITAWDAVGWPGSPPIGKPISGVSVRVVDAHMNLVPVGVTGELCAGGAALARGYAGQPGLTAARFVPDPFGPPGARMYRTGDLAYWIEPGLLGYAGRSDAQLKIRGVRVEPAEVEAVLNAHPAVQESGVTAQRYPDQDNRLVAYVVPEPAAPFDRAAVQNFARKRLPRAMVPTMIVVAYTLPHTSSGKIDRRALAALSVPPRPPGTRPRRLMTKLENTVAVVWRGSARGQRDRAAGRLLRMWRALSPARPGRGAAEQCASGRCSGGSGIQPPCVGRSVPCHRRTAGGGTSSGHGRDGHAGDRAATANRALPREPPEYAAAR